MTDDTITGCGWPTDPEDVSILEEIGLTQPTRSNQVPCAARDGHIPAFSGYEDTWTIGVVGLCRTCQAKPADLLHQLATTIDLDPDWMDGDPADD